MERASTTAAADDRRAVVLYVEDHPVNALLMEALFERRPSLRLVVATSGEAALAVAPGLDPQLLLLDLHLPDGHGANLLPRLRAVPGCADAPAVAVTADVGYDITGTGFAELWPKPLNLDLVLERLDRLVGETAARPRSRPLHLQSFVESGLMLS
jgi:CheY-like chemotaxis protein